MKKTLSSIILGIALLATSGVVNAEEHRSAEPRWGIRSERTGGSSPLDLARWLARRLIETVGETITVPLSPPSTPDTDTPPVPKDADEVCIPERGHCPLG